MPKADSTNYRGTNATVAPAERGEARIPTDAFRAACRQARELYPTLGSWGRRQAPTIKSSRPGTTRLPAKPGKCRSIACLEWHRFHCIGTCREFQPAPSPFEIIKRPPVPPAPTHQQFQQTAAAGKDLTRKARRRGKTNIIPRLKPSGEMILRRDALAGRGELFRLGPLMRYMETPTLSSLAFG